MPTGRKGRKEPRERLPGDEAAPLEHRPRTPSCASLNSSCSTASRDIEIISGGCVGPSHCTRCRLSSWSYCLSTNVSVLSVSVAVHATLR